MSTVIYRQRTHHQMSDATNDPPGAPPKMADVYAPLALTVIELVIAENT